MDIETAARSKIDVLTIVFSNGAMAIERKAMPFTIEQLGLSHPSGVLDRFGEGSGWPGSDE